MLDNNQTDILNESGGDMLFKNHIDAAVANFGTSLLTPREVQVLHLVLHGNSAKEAARSLNISLETVKQHRKSAYNKVGISSQKELFDLFVSALRITKFGFRGDPLASYINRQE